MRNFRVIENGRLNEDSMSKIVGGKPCSDGYNNCGTTGYSCNSAYGPTNPCPSFDSTGPEVCPGYIDPCQTNTCRIYKEGGGGCDRRKPIDLELMSLS